LKIVVLPLLGKPTMPISKNRSYQTYIRNINQKYMKMQGLNMKKGIFLCIKI